MKELSQEQITEIHKTLITKIPQIEMDIYLKHIDQHLSFYKEELKKEKFKELFKEDV